jgi:cyclopropane-fatty-acyl-phospholipid synthase
MMKNHRISDESVMPYPVTGFLAAGTFVRWCRNIFLKKIGQIEHGYVELREEEVVYHLGDRNAALQAIVEVKAAEFYVRVLFGGSVGAGEAYMEGLWRCNDLTTLVRIVINNSRLLVGLDQGLGRFTLPLHWLYHLGRKNTRKGSKKNISAHYDLGNDFYSLFLDPTMAYSAAVFPSEDTTLEEGSRAKFDGICRKLELSANDHLLEIGTGWGGFAMHAAEKYGCTVTTVTISQEQYEFAVKRITEAGLAGKITVQLKDYRDITGEYDKLVSIEMIEAVGHDYLDTFFSCCSSLLKPGGMMLLQAISIRDHAYDSYRKEVDFIRRYIFPGACLPSLTRIMHSVARVTDMTVFHLEDIASHYARTLQLWRRRFFTNINEVRQLGMSEHFIRMWEFYLCYCEAGFLEHHLGDLQLLFIKPGARPRSTRSLSGNDLSTHIFVKLEKLSSEY